MGVLLPARHIKAIREPLKFNKFGMRFLNGIRYGLLWWV